MWWKGFSLFLSLKKRKKNRRVILTKLIPHFHSAHDLLLLVPLSSRSLSTSFSFYSFWFYAVCVRVCHCMCLTSPKWRNIVLSLFLYPPRRFAWHSITAAKLDNKQSPPIPTTVFYSIWLPFSLGLPLISFCFVSFLTLFKWKKKFPLLQYRHTRKYINAFFLYRTWSEKSLHCLLFAHLPPKEKLENGNFSLGFFLVVRVVYICGQLNEDDEAGSGDDDKRKKNKKKEKKTKSRGKTNEKPYKTKFASITSWKRTVHYRHSIRCIFIISRKAKRWFYNWWNKPKAHNITIYVNIDCPAHRWQYKIPCIVHMFFIENIFLLP